MRAPPTAEAELDGQLAPVGDAEARAIVAHATRRYIAARHARVEGFVDRHFSLIGSLRLHRQAPGLDLVRAPANVLLMLPYPTMQLCGAGLRRLGAERAARWLGGRTPFLDTDVAGELGWRLHCELLELPYDDEHRCARGALAEAILADPGVAAAVDRLDAKPTIPSSRPGCTVSSMPTPAPVPPPRTWSTTSSWRARAWQRSTSSPPER
jgi:hypothetical protein